MAKTEEEIMAMDDEAFAEYENSQESIDDTVVQDDATNDNSAASDNSGDPDDKQDVDGGSEDQNVSDDNSGEDELDVEDDASGKNDDIIADSEIDKSKDDEDTSSNSETDDTQDETIDTSGEAAKDDTVNTQSDEIDYKALYEGMIAPIKFNGEDTDVKPEDIRSLVSKGLNHHQAMTATKPIRRVAATLEKAGLLKDGVIDEDKLNHLIDINSGNKEAILQKVKDVGIDTDEVDMDNIQYEQKNHIVNESESELNDISATLEKNGTYNSVVEAVGSMDVQSKEYFSNNPKMLYAIEQDINAGVYKDIMGHVQYERANGRLGAMSDMDAYIQIAKNTTEKPSVNEGHGEQPTQVKQQESNTVDKDKRRRAAPSKPKPAKQKAVLNPLEMSDEDYDKEYGGNSSAY